MLPQQAASDLAAVLLAWAEQGQPGLGPAAVVLFVKRLAASLVAAGAESVVAFGTPGSFAAAVAARGAAAGAGPLLVPESPSVSAEVGPAV